MGFKELEYGDMPSSMNISKVRYTEAADYQKQLQEQRAEARVIEIKPWFKQQAALTVQDYLDDFPEIHGEGGPASDTPMLINLGGAGEIPKDEMVPVECHTLLEFVQMWAERAGTLLTPLIGGEGLSYKIGFLDEEHKWVHMTRDAYREGRADLREDEGLHATLTELLAKIDPDLTPERLIKDLGNPAKRGELFHLGSKPIDLLPEDLKGYRAALREIPDIVAGRVKDTFDVQAVRPVSSFAGKSDAEIRQEMEARAEAIKAEHPLTYNTGVIPSSEEEAAEQAERATELEANKPTKTEGVCGGRACAAGTSIPVWTLEALRRQGATRAELLGAFPTVTPIALAKALLYADEFADEIQRDIENNKDGPSEATPAAPDYGELEFTPVGPLTVKDY